MSFSTIEIVTAMVIIVAGSALGCYLIDTAAKLILGGRQ